MNGRRVQSGQLTFPGTGSRPELVDIAWVAKRLGVTERHMRRLVAERRIPFVKWGHLLRFDPDEIETWIDAARKPSSS